MSAALPDQVALTQALVETGRWLARQGYHFTTVTPATQARVIARDPTRVALTLRDAFGWSLPFGPGLLPIEWLDQLVPAGLIVDVPGGLQRSIARFSSLRGELFAHSAWPTTDGDAVFFGPDTVRFVDLVERELEREPLRQGGRILDLGCGAGPGGLFAAKLSAVAEPDLVLADINPGALRFAAANAALCGVERVAFAEGDLFGAVDGVFDLVVSNPPYLNDAAGRTYRHGGGRLGEGLSDRIVRESLARLAPGGRLILYTGVATVDGVDPLLEAIEPVLAEQGWPWRYRELDPDVFGEELDTPAYAEAERIAAVALVVRRP